MRKLALRYRERDALISRLAHDIARQLEEYEADPALADAVGKMQSLYKRGFSPITAEQFENAMRLIVEGARTHCRRGLVKVDGSGVSPALLHRYLAVDPELRTRFEAARRHWRIYRGQSWLELEELMEDLARGDLSLQSACYSRGWDRNRYLRLLNLIARAPEIEQKYHLAKRAQFARIGGRLFEEGCAASTKKRAREISNRMDLLRRRLPHAIREVFHRDQTPIEHARRRAGLRQNGKRKEPAS